MSNNEIKNNAEQVNPIFDLPIGNKTYKVEFNFAVLIKVEAHLGINSLDEKFWEDLSATRVVTMVWALLTANEVEITFDEVAKKLAPSSFAKIMKVMGEGFKLSQTNGNDQPSTEGNSEEKK